VFSKKYLLRGSDEGAISELATPGKERLKEFTTKSGTGIFVYVWKRQKP
jgi:hypothetical protein